MKKIFTVILILFVSTFCFANTPEKNNAIVINKNEIPKINRIEIINNTGTDFHFAIYGYRVILNEWIPINKFQKSYLSKNKKCQIDFECAKYGINCISLGIDIGIIENYKEFIKNDIWIVEIDSVNTNLSLADDCKMDFSLEYDTYFDENEKFDTINKDTIFKGLLSGCIDILSDYSYEILLQDKSLGIIKGRYSDKCKYLCDFDNSGKYQKEFIINTTFTFYINDEKYRVVFGTDTPSLEFKNGENNLDIMFIEYATYKAYNKFNTKLDIFPLAVYEASLNEQILNLY